MRECNYCQLAKIKKRAKRELAKVILTSSPLGSFASGKNVFVVPAGSEARLTSPDDDPQSHWAGWFAEIPKGCRC